MNILQTRKLDKAKKIANILGKKFGCIIGIQPNKLIGGFDIITDADNAQTMKAYIVGYLDAEKSAKRAVRIEAKARAERRGY